MKIEFNTDDLSDLDRAVLALVANQGETVKSVVALEAEAPKPAPKPTAKPKPAPKPAPEPEPDEDGDDEGAAEYSLDDAVQVATKLVSKGKSSDVKAALTKLGVRRVSELKGGQIGEFIGSFEG